MGDWNGTAPTILAGYVPSGDDWSAILGELTALSAAWTDWSPTYANLTTASATINARYRRIGKTVDYYWQFVLGASSAVGASQPTLTLPVAPASHYSTGGTAAFPGIVHLMDASPAGGRQGIVRITSGSTIDFVFWNATPTTASVTTTTPWTWATGDTITIYGTYEAA